MNSNHLAKNTFTFVSRERIAYSLSQLRVPDYRLSIEKTQFDTLDSQWTETEVGKREREKKKLRNNGMGSIFATKGRMRSDESTFSNL